MYESKTKAMASSIATDTIIFGLQGYVHLHHRARLDLVKFDLPKETRYLLDTKLDVLTEILNIRRRIVEFSLACRDTSRVLGVVDFQIKKLMLLLAHRLTPIERKGLYDTFLRDLVKIKSDIETNTYPF